MTATALLIALVAVVVAVVVVINARRRTRLAANAARRASRAAESAARAAEAAQRHCDGLIELLADLSPSARRVWLVTRDRSPALAAAQRRQFQRRDPIDEGTT